MRSRALHQCSRVVSSCALAGLLAAFALAMVGCAERDPFTASDVAPRPPCECGAPVTTLAAPIEAAAAAPLPRVRLQQTVSLGYVGDGPLTQIEPRREWWGDGDRAIYGGYGYGYGYGYGRGGRGHAHAGASHGAQAPSLGAAAPSFGQGMATRTGSGGHSASPSPARGPR